MPSLGCRRGLKAKLVLEDGTVYHGAGFGAPGIVVGEVVFTTGMVGYPESLTDPSYKGQILTITHPLVGNYGVPSKELCEYGLPAHFESDRIQIEGLIVAEETDPNHWASRMSLHEWLASEGIPGISRVDTRALVKKIREKGVMMGILAVYHPSDEPSDEELLSKLNKSTRYDEQLFVDKVSPKEPITHEPPHPNGKTIALIDCGVKYGIVRELLRRGFRVVRVPYSYSCDQIMKLEPSGILVSNGPGNPVYLKDTIKAVRGLIEYGLPVLGICLGHQLISLALGAEIFKLKYGHRGQNKPCVDLVVTGKCYVTSQNHGYAVKEESIPETGLRLWFRNADDKTVEGLIGGNVLSVQFHPEASPGPYDTTWIFDLFAKRVMRNGVSK